MARLCCLALAGLIATGCASTPPRADRQATGVTVYKQALDKCNSDAKARRDTCHARYGPEPTNPGNPDAFCKCIAEANKDQIDCIDHAVYVYNESIAKDAPAPSSQHPSGR